MKNETTQEYNKYLEQIETILHPNLFHAFIKIHNKILEEEIEKAKSFRPSKEWVEIKKAVDRMKGGEAAFKKLYLKNIIKLIDKLPVDEGW